MDHDVPRDYRHKGLYRWRLEVITQGEIKKCKAERERQREREKSRSEKESRPKRGPRKKDKAGNNHPEERSMEQRSAPLVQLPGKYIFGCIPPPKGIGRAEATIKGNRGKPCAW